MWSHPQNIQFLLHQVPHDLPVKYRADVEIGDLPSEGMMLRDSEFRMRIHCWDKEGKFLKTITATELNSIARNVDPIHKIQYFYLQLQTNG